MLDAIVIVLVLALIANRLHTVAAWRAAGHGVLILTTGLVVWSSIIGAAVAVLAFIIWLI